MDIRLLIPARRAQGWHSVLAEALVERGHAVRVKEAIASPGPLAVRALLWIEARLFSARRLGRRLGPDERAGLNGAGEALPPDLTVDLTGARSDTEASRTLELTFDGSTDHNALIGALLAQRSPVMAVRRRSDGMALASSYLGIDDREVLVRALESACARMIALCVRAVERYETPGPAEIWSEPAPDYPPSPASARAVVRFASREFATKLRRQIHRQKSRAGTWSLAARRTDETPETPPVVSAPFSILAAGPDTWADPFIHEQDGRRVLFAERQSAATGVGVIVCAVQTDTGWGPFETCLQRPYHLSYPFVFDHDGETWMMPETGANRTLELYRAAEYPTRWTLDRVLMQDVSLADATLVHLDHRWWLFAARSEYGGSLRDELVAFHAPSPLGPWTPHPMNPLKSDVRSARPAGRFIVEDGRLYRPAQDCEAGYGAGLVWCEVTELTPTTFAERVVGRWRGADLGAEGVHSFARGGGMEVVDLKRAGGARTLQTHCFGGRAP